jgi:hypothetical protein
MDTLAEKLIHFYHTLSPPNNLPTGVEVLYPQVQPAVQDTIEKFLRKFFNDNRPRRVLMGINPGRFGAGVTGINFTAPRQLRDNCGIEHPFGNTSELSAEFIYEMIERFGGAKKFYKEYFISSVSPLGYVKNGKNLNYYDDKNLQRSIIPFVNDCIDRQLQLNLKRDYCLCIGGEKNYKFFSALNADRKKNGASYFETIVALPHPRFILQYRRKYKAQYIDEYIRALKKG